MYVFDFFMVLIGVLLGVAFFTLMERKFLGYVHFRKGPSKVFYFGLLQPISDVLKLFTKDFLKGYKFSFYMMLTAPVLGLFLMFVLWSVYSGYFGVFGSFYSFLYIFCFMSLGVYFFLLCCWGSGSKYSLMGGYRSVSQIVSYEVVLIFFVLVFVYLVCFYDISFLFFFQMDYWLMFFSLLLSSVWLFVVLAEINRTPFDFSEGESELVSGFNVEYSGGVFSLIFVCEYGMMIYLAFLSTCLLMGMVFFLIKLLFFSFFIVWFRCCFPRYRYDLLMYSAWKILLPFVIFILSFFAIMYCWFSGKGSYIG